MNRRKPKTLRDRVSSGLPLPLRIAADSVRGSDYRHRAAARFRAVWRGLTPRASTGSRPTVAIALVEHFGDIVAAEPLIDEVRARHPGSRLVWVAREPFRELVIHHPRIDGLIPVTCLTEWIEIKRFKLFEAVYDLHVHRRACDRCRVEIDRSADGDPSVSLDNYYDHGNLLTAFSRSAGLPPIDRTPRLYQPPETAQAVDRLALPPRFVAIHARSNETLRNWTDAKWRELVGRLTRSGIEVVEVGGTPAVSLQDPRYRDLTGRLSLLESAEVIRRAAAFVGIDSGPAHLANAVGTRGVILLGHYHHFRRYVPYSGAYASGANATLLYADGPAASLAVDEVEPAVREAVAREPAAREVRA